MEIDEPYSINPINHTNLENHETPLIFDFMKLTELCIYCRKSGNLAPILNCHDCQRVFAHYPCF